MSGLPVPIPASEAVGNFITAALWNAQIYNAFTFLLNPPIFSVAQTSTQALANTTMTSITWPTPTFDSYGGYASGTPTRYIPQVAGWYLAVGNVAFLPNATGARVAQIAKNGSSVVNQVATLSSGAAFNSVVGVVSLINCNGTTDYFELQADHNAGAGMTTVVALTSLTVLWVHA